MKWIGVDLGGTTMWLREDSKARILAENLHDDEFRLETRDEIGGDWTAAETPFPTLDAAKEAA